VRTQSLLHNLVAMGFEGRNTDEGAAEVMALSRRDRHLVAETARRLSRLQLGDDNIRAREIVAEALRRGDEAHYWRDAIATDRREKARSVTGNDASATSSPIEAAGIGSVTAHSLLNSSAVVSMGISTLLRLWDSLPAAERTRLLVHMEAHATTVNDGLKLLTRGLDSEVALSHTRSNGSASGRTRTPLN
jgi:hypothetical protein